MDMTKVSIRETFMKNQLRSAKRLWAPVLAATLATCATLGQEPNSREATMGTNRPLSITNGQWIIQAALFTAREDGYHTYRIPALVVTTQGTILAFCEGRENTASDSGDIDIVLKRSLDHGATWEPMQVVVDDGVDTCGNPAPVVDRTTGVIWLPFTKNKGDGPERMILRGAAPSRTVWVTESADDGVTWSEPIEISQSARKPDWRWYATGPCHAIQLRNGKLVVPCNHSLGPDTSTWHSHVIYSDDAGATWKLGGIHDGYTNESTVVELADGTLYQNMRSYRGTNRRLYALSADQGLTWSASTEHPTLVEPVCQASCLRLTTEEEGSKNRVLFSNPASTKREKMTVRLSYDECRTWAVAKMLYEGPSAYSDLAIAADGIICCLYERGRRNPYETVTFARFTLEWLTNGADTLHRGDEQTRVSEDLRTRG